MSPDRYLGIMTGTSLDAIDSAICRFHGGHVDLISFHTTPWPENLRSLLFELATSELVRMDDITQANFLLAREYARAVEETLAESLLAVSDIRAIGLHGQTVRHLPKKGATLQLGSGPALSALSGIDVVYDFRSADMAVGGQGAPLMPMFDFAFFRSEQTDRALLNIGGIANITWLPKNGSENDVIAFDTGPGNMPIDAISQMLFGTPFDRNGERARSGDVNNQILERMLADPYFMAPPPKTTGRELFGEQFLEPLLQALEQGTVSSEDALATVTECTARSIAESVRFPQPTTTSFELIVSGGGTHNTFLMERLAANVPAARILTSDDFGIPSQAKEAIAFAFFASAAIEGRTIHLPRTTGARKHVMLGSLSKSSGLSVE